MTSNTMLSRVVVHAMSVVSEATRHPGQRVESPPEDPCDGSNVLGAPRLPNSGPPSCSSGQFVSCENKPRRVVLHHDANPLVHPVLVPTYSQASQFQ